MTEKEVINMIADFDLSDKKMMAILRRLKSLFGKKAFTPGIAEALIERKTVDKILQRRRDNVCQQSGRGSQKKICLH